MEEVHSIAPRRKPRSRTVQVPRSGPPLFIPFPKASRKDPPQPRNPDREKRHPQCKASSYERRCSSQGNILPSIVEPSSNAVRTMARRRQQEKRSMKPKLGIKQKAKTARKSTTISNDEFTVGCKKSLRKDLSSSGAGKDCYDRGCDPDKHHQEPERKAKEEEPGHVWHGRFVKTKRKIDGKDAVFNHKETELHARKASLRHSLGVARSQRLALRDGDALEQGGFGPPRSTCLNVKDIVQDDQYEEKGMLEKTAFTNAEENSPTSQADNQIATTPMRCAFDADDIDTERTSETGKGKEKRCEDDAQHVRVDGDQTNDGQDMAESAQKNLPIYTFEVIGEMDLCSDCSNPCLLDVSRSHLPKKLKVGLSEAEQAIKKEVAARKRKQEMERNAKQTQANAIRKILGQDSSRKRREENLVKLRQELEKEQKAVLGAPPINSIRWIMGPSGNVVSFSKDLEISSFFPTPCSYPREREKCAGPFCNNAYKYRDSKTQIPLCSLQCYKAVQVHSRILITS